MISLRLIYVANDAPSPASSASLDLAPIEFTHRAPVSWRVADLKQFVEETVGFPIASLFWKGRALAEEDELLLFDMSSEKRTNVLTFTKQTQAFRICEASTLMDFSNRAEAYRLAPALKALREINAHFAGNHVKIKQASMDSGSGGTYFIKNGKSQVLGCFKPRQEELGASLNPATTALRAGVEPGCGAEREAAAFALDHAGFAGVPPTLLVEANPTCFAASASAGNGNAATKIGSFQYFVPNAEENVGDYSPHLFRAKDVHRVALLDLRYLNMDRNDSNLLVVRRNGSELHLVPIDHGLCFPDRIEVAWCDLVWLDWPQTLVPFDAETKQWVGMLDVQRDMNILRNTFGLNKRALRVFYCMNTLLQCAISRYDLNLREIATAVVRSRSLDDPSAMELTVERAAQLAELMAANSRKSASLNRILDSKNNNSAAAEEEPLLRSSSFDSFPSVKIPKPADDDVAAKVVAEEDNNEDDRLYFSYVDRLIDDICQEIVFQRERMAKKETGGEEREPAVGWFDVSQRLSPSELTKMPSPRLQPSKPLPAAAAAATKMLPPDGKNLLGSLADFALE